LFLNLPNILADKIQKKCRTKANYKIFMAVD